MKIPGTNMNIPPWAIIASGGVIGGGIVVNQLRKRTETAKEASSDVAEGTYVGAVEAQPAPGIVVPPIYNQPSADPGYGPNDLLQTYFGGFQDLLSYQLAASTQVGEQWESVNAGLTTGWESIGSTWREFSGIQNEALENSREHSNSIWQTALTAAASFTGGGTPTAPAPGGVVATPSQTTNPNPCPAQFPLRSSRGCYNIEYDKRTRRSGQNAWCNQVTIHRYQYGDPVVVAENKVKNGAC